jgi:APA family basic amino acid/polyamine antiporter
VIFAALVFYALTTIGLFVLRAKRPDAERPYRAIGYPVLPALYLVLTTVVMLLILLAPSSRQDAFLGLTLVVIGVPVYFLWRRVEPDPRRESLGGTRG